MLRLPHLAPLPCALLLLLPFAGEEADEPESAASVPGLAHEHPLDQRRQGLLLLDELNCGACHAGLAPDVTPAPAPRLEDVGARVDPRYLTRFVADPASTQPGTKMPNVLAGLAPDERERVALEITHYLVRSAERAWTPGSVDEGERVRGGRLFHTIGCVACHPADAPPNAPVDARAAAARESAVSLEHVGSKYGVDSLANFLFQPERARPSGRMPDMGLSRGEARALASYLIGSAPRDAADFAPNAELATAGRRHFERYGCAACHEPAEGTPPFARAASDVSRGCLGDDANTPRYALSASQREALRLAAAGPRSDATPRERVEQTLTAFHCIGCHERDGYGGVDPRLDAYFETDQLELGDTARIPPPLTATGAKLQPNWMRRVLFDHGRARPYMFTRMPAFGEANLAELPELFEALDAGSVEPFEVPIPKGEEANAARQAGRELLGIRGLACISCHDFNGRPAPVHRGTDLIHTTERLTPGWFARFLIDPTGYRPGIVMPESWPGGRAAHSRILEGDTDAQLRAIWYFLSQGRTARDPEGIRPKPSRLSVADEPRTYRGRSRVAGFRGIAVGSPQGLHFAFDANNGSLAALWRGDFVNVRWDGQGAGDFTPAAAPVALARDVSFWRLPDETSAWPLRPRTNEEQPENPDPTYPRAFGYRFLGYELVAGSAPTLRYASGAVTIEDRCEVEGTEASPVLRRTLRLRAPAPERLHFRALAGAIEEAAPGEFRTKGLALRIGDNASILRSIDIEEAEEGTPEAAAGEAPMVELLIPLELAAGESTLTLRYELTD